MMSTRVLAISIVIAFAGCTQSSSPIASLPTSTQPSANAEPSTIARSSHIVTPQGFGAPVKIQHVVIIVQENRTVNDLFNGFPGALTVRTAKNSFGKLVYLRPIPLTAPYDIGHTHTAFATEYAGGKMNGFNLVTSSCDKDDTCAPAAVRAYGYVPAKEIAPYFIMAKRYAFANHMFQTNEGPSFPAHQYLLSGTSTISDGSSLRASENPQTPKHKETGGCNSPAGSVVRLIDPQGNENQTAYPCFNRNSLIQLIEAKSLTWHYYQDHLGPGLWEAPDAIAPVFHTPLFASDVVAPPSQVLKDIAAGSLANVVWVTPTWAASDHAGSTDGSGPSWVASVVNKIGLSKYWKNTAIFVTWDDWGGWYDPMPPAVYNSYELSFRVPLLVISAYAKPHYISPVQHEFASILKFTEKAFDLGSLGTTDVRADDLSDCFDFSKGPQRFIPIPAPLNADYFLRQPVSNKDPDDDF
jgi:phospholipase C